MKYCISLVFLSLSILLLTSCAESKKYFMIINESQGKVEVKYKREYLAGGYFNFEPVIQRTDMMAKEVVMKEDTSSIKERIVLESNKFLVLGALSSKESKKLEVGNYTKFNLKEISIKSSLGSVQKEDIESFKIFFKDADGNFTVLITN